MSREYRVDLRQHREGTYDARNECQFIQELYVGSRFVSTVISTSFVLVSLTEEMHMFNIA